MTNEKIGVVLVTFNRLQKLKKALECYAMQELIHPSYMIVVDNASTDGTMDFLQDWMSVEDGLEKKVVRLHENLGGSGGFYEGLRIALEKDAPWIWVADDDAYPERDCFSIATDFVSTHSADDLSALCGSIVFNKKISTKHRRRTFIKGLRLFSIPVSEQEYESPFFLNTYSFVGSILNKEKLKQAGLPKKDYFIWNDDSEHSLRMSRFGKIVCLPQMRINHDEGEDSRVLSWKTYYGIRNYFDLVRSHFPRYYAFLWIKFIFIIIYTLLTNKDKGILYMTAFKDATTKNFGLHKKYKPGWKFKN